MKIIFVASDFSGLGKGTLCASLGRAFKSFGIETRIMKSDLYFNYDAGTINPFEHGEVYVLGDGTETDQDLGIYERFLGIELCNKDYITSGRIFHQIYLNERGGKYLGDTVSVEHIIEEIKSRLIAFAEQSELGIVELGATIGDIKGVYLLEACRQMVSEFGRNNCLFVLLTHIPYLNNVSELKTMGCQRSVNELRSKGIKPDIIVARTVNHEELPEYQMKKIQLYCEVPHEAIYTFPDLNDEYEIPKRIRATLMHNYIALKLGILLGTDKLDSWYADNFHSKIDLKVALVGKYSHQDAYISILHQLRFWGVTDVTFKSGTENLTDFDAVIIPGGWGSRGAETLIEAARICREEKIPCLGICLGLQIMVIEYSRNVLGIVNAHSVEFEEKAPSPVVILQENQKKQENMGGTSRLGNWTTVIDKESRTAKIFNSTEIIQRHRHRFEISPDFDYKNFHVVGKDKDENLIEIMELDGHDFYIGVQFHPEFVPYRSPLFKGLIDAGLKRKRLDKASGSPQK
jgi:CTP synthase